MFQAIYDFIKGVKTPLWLKTLLGELQKLIIATALSIGKEYLKNLENKIFEVSNMNIPSEEKFKIVFKFGKDTMPSIKDSVLNLIIEILVSLLKNNGFIRIS